MNYEPEGTRREDLEKFFAQWGTVDRVQMKDKYSFVEVHIPTVLLCLNESDTLSFD